MGEKIPTKRQNSRLVQVIKLNLLTNKQNNQQANISMCVTIVHCTHQMSHIDYYDRVMEKSDCLPENKQLIWVNLKHLVQYWACHVQRSDLWIWLFPIISEKGTAHNRSHMSVHSFPEISSFLRTAHLQFACSITTMRIIRLLINCKWNV